MRATQTLRLLIELGVDVGADGDGLRCWPAGLVNGSLGAGIRSNKPSLLSHAKRRWKLTKALGEHPYRLRIARFFDSRTVEIARISSFPLHTASKWAFDECINRFANGRN